MCGLSGQVPPDITFLHKLVSLDISFNSDLYHPSSKFTLQLRPRVFINMFRNFTHLEELLLDDVNISSVLPTSLNISSSLKILSLYNTRLQGNLPPYFFNLHFLDLDLGYNQFTGNIPLKITVNMPLTVPIESFSLPSLNSLYLDFNNFSDEWELDTLLSSLTNLDDLDLSYSGFSLTTKNSNHHVNPGFRELQLAACKLKVFPNSFRAMKQLEVLDLSSNEIHGQITHWAGETRGNELNRLNLSHNSITGLPQFQWYGLNALYLDSNLIQEPFPPSICNMSNLMYLDMSNNRFGGWIPQCFGKITSSLIMIDLGNNSFQGTIPNIYGDCGAGRLTGLSLRGLILNGNQLEGEVPISWSKCQSLEVLDFGNNHLNGTFPGWLGDLPYLKVLVLKSNNFHGHVQPSATVHSPFPSLQVLDLSDNRFVGQLPAKYFQSFNSMKNVVKSNTTPKYLSIGPEKYSIVVTVKGVNQYFPQILVDYTIIDLSDNTFEGQIPNVIGGLNSLIVLNLSHNSLIGPIPHALGNLTEIESLNLSWNQLSGEIPQSLADIKTLEVLNLSQNLLVGHIPQGPQFTTFEGNSFGGNPRLCGTPLLKKCGEYSHEPQLESDEGFDEESGFTWEVVMLAYGCGIILGLVIGV
ncbi:leucine-rich repeat-containing protein [Tanacetum coccineum]